MLVSPVYNYPSLYTLTLSEHWLLLCLLFLSQLYLRFYSTPLWFCLRACLVLVCLSAHLIIGFDFCFLFPDYDDFCLPSCTSAHLPLLLRFFYSSFANCLNTANLFLSGFDLAWNKQCSLDLPWSASGSLSNRTKLANYIDTYWGKLVSRYPRYSQWCYWAVNPKITDRSDHWASSQLSRPNFCVQILLCTHMYFTMHFINIGKLDY